MPNCWILKSEPTVYSFACLLEERRTVWDGITNALALKHLRSMAPGDLALIYHTGDEKAAVGLARVARAAYPDPRPKTQSSSWWTSRPTARSPSPFPSPPSRPIPPSPTSASCGCRASP